MRPINDTEIHQKRHTFEERDMCKRHIQETCKRDIYKRHVKEIPLTEEIRLKIVGSPDFSGFPRKVFE